MADKAGGQVVFEGENGAEIPKGTRLVRDDGAEYVTNEHSAIGDSGEATVRVTAARAGAKAECDPGAVLELKAELDGVKKEVMVSVGGLAVGPAAPAAATANSASDPKGGDLQDESAPPRVKLTVMLNGGNLTTIPADVLDATSRPDGAVLYDLRAQLPDGRVVRMERVRAKPEHDVAAPPYYEELDASAEAAATS